MLWLWYLMHSHNLADKNSSCAIIFFHIGLGNNCPKTYPADTSWALLAMWCRTNTYTEEFPQDLLCAFNISTPSAFSLPRCLLQCQHCTEGYLSKEKQYIPLCVSQKASQLWARSHWGILSRREPEAQVFVLSQTLHGNGDETKGKAECLIPEEEHSYSTVTPPLQRLKHLAKVVLKIKSVFT